MFILTIILVVGKILQKHWKKLTNEHLIRPHVDAVYDDKWDMLYIMSSCGQLHLPLTIIFPSNDLQSTK